MEGDASAGADVPTRINPAAWQGTEPHASRRSQSPQDDETGTVVSPVVNLNARVILGFVAFPQWVWKDTAKTHGRKQEKPNELLALREQGPDAPRKLAYMTGKIIAIEELGENRPNVF